MSCIRQERTLDAGQKFEACLVGPNRLLRACFRSQCGRRWLCGVENTYLCDLSQHRWLWTTILLDSITNEYFNSLASLCQV